MLALTAFGALVVFFIIHPSAFIQFPLFLEYQSTLGGFVNGENATSLQKALRLWKEVLDAHPGTLILMALLIPGIIAGFWYYRITRRPEMLWLAVNALSALLLLAVIITMNRLFIMVSYLQPVYPLLILNFIALLVWARDTQWRGGWVLHVIGMYLGAILIGGFMLYSVQALYDRLNYKDSIASITYEYVRQNVGANTRVVHDHFVAIPEAMKLQSCHYWQGCGTDAIEEFAPDVLMFNPEFRVSEKPYAETERLKRYVREHGFIHVTDLKAQNVTISVYRRPEKTTP